MDPREEAVLDILERPIREVSIEEFQLDGSIPHSFSESSNHGAPRKWSKRAEAARKRWADPVYRAKMLEKRAEKRRRDAEETNPRLEIGVMDSITLCDDDKAQAINNYARSNKIRSEKITAFHRNKRQWMEKRLSDTPAKLTNDEYVSRKMALREKRRQSAFKRIRNIKRKEQLETTEVVQPAEQISDPMLSLSDDSCMFDEDNLRPT